MFFSSLRAEREGPYRTRVNYLAEEVIARVHLIGNDLHGLEALKTLPRPTLGAPSLYTWEKLTLREAETIFHLLTASLRNAKFRVIFDS